jgi:acetyl-CoA acetyltransferase
MFVEPSKQVRFFSGAFYRSASRSENIAKAASLWAGIAKPTSSLSKLTSKGSAQRAEKVRHGPAYQKRLFLDYPMGSRV